MEIIKDKLYQSALDLYQHKAVIEKHLSTTTNELFDLQDRIMLFGELTIAKIHPFSEQ